MLNFFKTKYTVLQIPRSGDSISSTVEQTKYTVLQIPLYTLSNPLTDTVIRKSMKEGRLLTVRTREESSAASGRPKNENENENENNKQNNEEEEEEPLSPTNSWLLHSSIQCLAILEWNERIDSAEAREFWVSVYCQFPRLSCIVREDSRGNLKLYRITQVDIDDHLLFTELPEEEKQQETAVEEYITRLETMQLDRSKPQWELHILRGGSSKTVVVFKFHHSLADGVSIMSFLLSMARSASDPSRKPTMPRITAPAASTLSLDQQNCVERLLLTPMKAVADAMDVGLRMMGLRYDSVFPRQHVMNAVTQTQDPCVHRKVAFSLKLVKSIKNMMAATVNDVICGIIFHAFKRYLEIRDAAVEAKVSIELAYERRSELLSASAMKPKRQPTKFTANIPLNTRAVAALMEMQGSSTDKSKASWGNNFVPTFLDLCLESGDTVSDVIYKLKRIIDSKKKSAYLQLFLMRHLTRYLNLKIASSCLQRANSSASVLISNLAGPTEKICLSSYTVTHFRFSVTPIPCALVIFICSYVDEMTLNVVALKPLMDINVFCKCLDESFAQVASAVKMLE